MQFTTYQTIYTYDTGIQSIEMKSQPDKPTHKLGETIDITLFVNNKMVKRPSKIVKIEQEIKITDDKPHMWIVDFDK